MSRRIVEEIDEVVLREIGVKPKTIRDKDKHRESLAG
jgi:hypothetical protein